MRSLAATGGLARRTLWTALVCVACARGQDALTNTSDGPLAAMLVMGGLTPGTSVLATGLVQFRLSTDNKRGSYRLDASATFTSGAGPTVNGGASIAASDIGIGITSIMPEPGVAPRADTILPGFDYDPTTLSAVDGLTPYAGAAAGSATLADLSTSKMILSGNGIGGKPKFLTVTMKFGLLPQYFSPSSFSAIVTLTYSTAP